MQAASQRAALFFDTPTPPSQSYSEVATGASAGDPLHLHLQTSLRPRYQQEHEAAALKKVTSTPAAGLKQQRQQEREMDMDMDTTFTTSDFGGGAADIENVDPLNRSVGLGMADKQRFLDLQQQQQQPGRKRRGAAGYAGRTRVDEYSDATLDSTEGEGEESTASSTEEDDLAARLGLNHRQQHHHQQQHQNVSKSAFDGMARELRREFERIMESGKKASPAQHRGYSLQAPAIPFPSSNNQNNNLSVNPVGLPRGVPPPSKQQQQQLRASPMTQRTAASNPYINAAASPMNRRDSTPTSVRTFGQELHAPRQQQAIPSPRFAISPKSALKQPSHQQQYQHNAVSYATSPFQVSSTVPASGILPPNNTRATAKSASPNLGYHPAYLKDSFSPPHATSAAIRRTASASPHAAVRVPDITGLTEGLTSPSRVASGPSSHRELPRDRTPLSSLGRSHEGEFGCAQGRKGTERLTRNGLLDPALSSALVGLRQRLEALESENARSEAKVAELEDKLASRGVDPASIRSTREDGKEYAPCHKHDGRAKMLR